MTEPFVGEVRLMGFNFPPRGWAQCNGQLLPINQNTALFSLLGTTYGGNGTTNFALPDLRGRLPMHVGQGPGLSLRDQGEIGGSEAVTLLTTQLPAHTHANGIADVERTTNRPTGIPARGGAYAATATASVASGAAGGGQPHENMPPFLVLNWCIALQGVFPSRN